ncbi:reverse transcriptase [Gossypium australe]|uniref:Reverse transcriptase n=1 Tax=Gossypium australe TaxID=47621 RepID=A0A5B6X8X5_9ROSI|nr:reverse transcriptase [Gossypium australe]
MLRLERRYCGHFEELLQMACRCFGQIKWYIGGMAVYRVVWFSIFARSRCGVEFAEKVKPTRGESKGSKENGSIQRDNRRVGNLPKTNIRERLDRGLANDKWLNLFPLGNIHHLSYSTFDHCPLLINSDKVSRFSGDRNFHFEVYWEQRARVNWLQSGDRNTAYFHNCATARRHANIISKLILDDGREIHDAPGIHEEAKLYFENLFNTNGVANLREVLEGVEESISVEANEDLLAPFSEDEVLTALKGMGPTKAPGPDGFPAIFFQKYWHIVGKEVLGFCLGVLNEGKEVDSANMTNIVLIPKVQNPTSMVNFRLISLCSVLYKLIAKTIANRMQNVMDTCINQVQSAFVLGRLISDNILLAYEILHTFRQK